MDEKQIEVGGDVYIHSLYISWYGYRCLYNEEEALVNQWVFFMALWAQWSLCLEQCEAFKSAQTDLTANVFSIEQK